MSKVPALSCWVALALCCFTMAAAAGFCETDDLPGRANMPKDAVCKGDVYDIPTPHPDHIYQITHFRRSLPFSEFENWMRELGNDPARRQSDQAFIDYVMSSAVRNEFAAFSTIEGTLDFEWLDGTGQLLDDWNMPVPPDYLPAGYPPEAASM